jgi:hypothetical protein
MIRLAIRGYAAGVLQFENRLERNERELGLLLPTLAEEHANAMAAGRLSMIEIEFLDEPDPLTRYFRIGTDPSGMVIPIQVQL